jgi:hypothetical protein
MVIFATSGFSALQVDIADYCLCGFGHLDFFDADNLGYLRTPTCVRFLTDESRMVSSVG